MRLRRQEVGTKAMNLDNYQFKAMETAVYPEKIGLQYTILGLAGEAGEVANLYKKVLRDHNGDISAETLNKLLDELGAEVWAAAIVVCEQIFLIQLPIRIEVERKDC